MTDLSRRTALRALIGAAPAAIALPALAQEPQMPPGDGVGADPEGVVITIDTWTDTYGRPTASVMLNDQGPFAFLVDTGSTATVMSEKVAAVLGIEPAGALTVAGSTGTAVRPYTVIETLQAGAVTRNDIRIAILSGAGLARGDGILGADVFAGKRLVFSIHEKVVRVEASRRKAGSVLRGNLRLRNGLLAEVDGRVGNIAAKLVLDTGADYCILNPVLGAMVARAYPGLTRVPNVRVTGVTGHRIFGEYTPLPRVDVKEFVVEDSGAVVANAPIFDLWGLTKEPAMIVGVDLLSRLASFSIDYGARQFDAELADAMIARNFVELG